MKTSFSLFPATVAIKEKYPALLFLLFVFCVFPAHAQDNLIKRKVSVDVQKKPLESVLMEVSDLAQFTFSYDATILPADKIISLHAKEATVKNILDKILSEDIDYKVSGNHLILLKQLPVKEEDKKEKYIIKGQVYHARNKSLLSDIVVYEVSSLISTVTDKNGKFSMEVPAKFTQLGISFNNKTFRDTIVFIPPKDQWITIALTPVHVSAIAEKLSRLPLHQPDPIESLPLVQQFVPAHLSVRTQNMGFIRQRLAQISFLPTIGTNLKMSGLIKNRFSVNVLAGYAYGVEGFEMGGLFNITRKDVNGFQIGGLGNLVGETTKGVQIAGLFNHSRGSISGVQIGGITNIALDTLDGIQIAGIYNILKGGTKGWQIAGLSNNTTEDVDGVQIAGLTNIGAEDVQKLQIAGLANISQNVSGIQVAGLVNYSAEHVKGLQFAGLVNKAQYTDAIQFAGVANITQEKVSGIQLSGIFNYAKYVEGVQVGLVNVADSSSGTPIGFFSFVKNGFHELEFSTNELIPANIAFKTGVKRFYNIFSGGYGSWGGESRWWFGYGLGTERALNQKFAINFEYTQHWVNVNKHLQKDLSLLNTLSINLLYRKNSGLSFSAGPAIHLWLSEWRDPETGKYLSQLAPYTLVDTKIGTSLAQMWIGGKLAVHW